MPDVVLTNRFDTALLYASQVHRGQKCGDEDHAIAALLHDAEEDQGGRPRLDDIRARLSRTVEVSRP